MDNPVRPTRSGSLEALMGSVRDSLLVGMIEQRAENKRRPSFDAKDLCKLKKPNEALGFLYEEIPTFDVAYAKEFG